MSCYHPLVAINRGKPIDKVLDSCNGEYDKRLIMFRKSTESNRQYLFDLLDNDYFDIYPDANVVEVPCGSCLGCRLDYSLDWALRLVAESKTCKDAYMLTLTYDDDHLPMIKPNRDLDVQVPTLWTKSEFGKWFKNFRRQVEYHYSVTGLRYFMCAEYGSKFHRPHYHLILFNFHFPDLIKWNVTKAGSQLYRSPFLEKVWKYGFSSVGEVNPECCAYVARYVLKKQKDPCYYDGRVQEWTNMSRSDAIGRKYYDLHRDDIYKTDSIPIKFSHKSVLALKPPSYYDKLFDIDFPDKMKNIKDNRKVAARAALIDKCESTDMSLDQIRSILEKSKLEKVSLLKRGFEESD